MLLKPKFRFYRVTEITPAFLQQNGIKGLLLDVDNTLSTDNGQELLTGLREWIAEMQDNGIRLTVISNAAKKRLIPFAGKIGMQFVHRAAKPLFWGYLMGAHRLGLKKKETAMVGDQLFTDILGANLIGMPSILVEPILLETGKSFVIRRRLEKKILKKERGQI
ncbi:MAG: YqeG family HAD IIIA-type phosphatase [Clostridia bacterium]|nr:YqeG family HAD IIIA-type phosphatase [Clostridia bacterium]